MLKSLSSPVKKVVLDDPVTVGRVGKLEAEDLGVLLGLLEAIPCVLIRSFRFDDPDHEIACITQEVIGSLLGTARDSVARHDDPPIGESLLLADLVVTPASGV